MPDLNLRNISKRYGRDSWALHPIDLTARDGEFLVLLGPSGCGKSTTIRIIAGLVEPTSGTVHVGDREITDLPPRKRRLSMVFQNYAVWPHMTVYDNVAFPLRLQKRPKTEIDRMVREMTELVAIEHLLTRRPDQLSGGQRQRVALARALAVEPEVFLMDEPLSNLDAKLRGQMRTELRAIHQRTGATTVFVTHDQAEAMSLADRIVVMHEGRIIQVGTPEEIYSRSASRFVAAFIGSPPANFFVVQVRGGKLVHNAFTVELPASWQSAAAGQEGRELELAVRPEDLLPTHESDAHLSRAISVVEPQGSHQIVAFMLGKEMVKAIAPASPRLAPGAVVHLRFRLEHLMLFDSRTGERVEP